MRRTAAIVAVGVGLAVSQGACSKPDAPEREPVPATADREQDVLVKPEALDPYDLWAEALYDLRDRTEAGEKIKLNIARESCLYWPATLPGAYTLVKNPALYVYEKDNQQILFYPFLAHTTGRAVIMNGPFQYTELDKDGNQIFDSAIGNISSVEYVGSQMFDVQEVVLEALTESDDPFEAAWFDTGDGVRIAETMLVTEEELAQKLHEYCEVPLPWSEDPNTI